jgi:hypothetical protein
MATNRNSSGWELVSVCILFLFASTSSRYTHPILLSSQPFLSFSLTTLRQSCDFIKTSHVFTTSPLHSTRNPRSTVCPKNLEPTGIIIAFLLIVYRLDAATTLNEMVPDFWETLFNKHQQVSARWNFTVSLGQTFNR